MTCIRAAKFSANDIPKNRILLKTPILRNCRALHSVIIAERMKVCRLRILGKIHQLSVHNATLVVRIRHNHSGGRAAC